MAGHGEELSRCQERAIIALLERRTIKEAAEQTKISERTLRRWLQRPEFQAAYRAAQAKLLEDATAILQHASLKAASTLYDCLNSGKESDRIRAAAIILDLAEKAVERDVIQTQLDELRLEVERMKRKKQVA